MSLLGWGARTALAGRWPLVAELAVAAAVTAGISASDGSSRSIRLALGFLLAGVLLLPYPGGILVAVTACAVGRGGGIAGPQRRGIGMCTAVAASLALACSYRAVVIPAGTPGPAALLFHLGVLYALVQLVATAIHAPFALLPSAPPATPSERSPLALAVVESVNVGLAWLLVPLFAGGAWLPGTVLAALVLLGATALRKLDLAHQDLLRSNTALAARVGELATLHSIGREILSSLDPSRVFSIVERECRKIFEVDFFFVARMDHSQSRLHFVFRGAPEEATLQTDLPFGRGLASWVVAGKRGIRVDDFHDADSDLPFRPEVADVEIRSALAVPLTVEERVIGVLSVQSRKPRAYDDHLLSVLTTIAQQAAVAIENARHYEMATVDSMTRLFLRDYFFRRLEEEHERARRYRAPFALLMMDLDSFKEINDDHGHLGGDRYLRALGGVIRDRLRGPDLACRYGGDEFCLLLPETDLAGALAFGERMRAAVAELTVEAEGPAMRSTISIGVALFPEHDTKEMRDLVLRADLALYDAKRAGKDRVVVFSARSESAPARARG